MNTKPKRKQFAVILMIVSALCATIMQSFSKSLSNLNLMQRIFFKDIFCVILTFIMIIRSKEATFHIKKGGKKWVLLRCILSLISFICLFYATDYMNLADANILYRMSPFFILILSHFFLKERLNYIKVFCIVIAMLGSILVIKPQFNSEFGSSMIGLASAVSAGAMYVILKLLSNDNNSLTLAFYNVLFSTGISLPFVFTNTIPLTSHNLYTLIGLGIFSALSQIMATVAVKYAPVSEITIYNYASIFFSMIIGILFFKDYPDIQSILGAILIIGSGIFLYIRRFNINPQEKKLMPPNLSKNDKIRK